jgi:hypothetical protein
MMGMLFFVGDFSFQIGKKKNAIMFSNPQIS